MQLDKIFTLWPIPPFGGQDDPPPQNDPKDSGGQQNPPNGSPADGNPPDPKPTEKKDDSDEDENDPLAGLSAKELRRVVADTEKRAKDAETERDSFKTAADEEARKKRTREENLENDVKSRDATIAALRATNARLAIIGAIRDETKWSWHNPEIVAQQLDPKVVKVNDEGKVDGLKADLARIAKDHPYLLATHRESKGPTGFQPGQGGQGQGKSKADLAKDYPALLTRM